MNLSVKTLSLQVVFHYNSLRMFSLFKTFFLLFFWNCLRTYKFELLFPNELPNFQRKLKTTLSLGNILCTTYTLFDLPIFGEESLPKWLPSFTSEIIWKIWIANLKKCEVLSCFLRAIFWLGILISITKLQRGERRSL